MMGSGMTQPSFMRRLAWAAVALTFVVVVLGAYVRLSHAGLGCPDWPGCYGHVTWPNSTTEINSANLAFPERAVDTPKAGKEMVHRFFAGSLGLLVLALALSAARDSRLPRTAVIVSALMAIVAIVSMSNGLIGAALVCAALAVFVPFAGALTWRAPSSSRLLLATLGLIIFQAMLGMWTVTLKLKPIIVTAHLLGGLATLGLLLWAALRMCPHPPRRIAVSRTLAFCALAVLVMQIFLGGWTSTNYAALSCPEFPTCLGQWIPSGGFREGFVLFREIGVNYEGGVLDGAARAAIHWSHRVGALVVLLVLGALITRLFGNGGDRRLGWALLLLLGMQISLGIGNVVLQLPLVVATAHNAVAALLLATLLVILSRTAAGSQTQTAPLSRDITR